MLPIEQEIWLKLKLFNKKSDIDLTTLTQSGATVTSMLLTSGNWF
jgi:hypothetical protein